jgi:hypothetical protein
MRTRPVRRMTRSVRVARGLWPDHNPLRRPLDRAEAGMLAVLIMAFLVGTPLIALIAWRLTFSAAFTTAEAQLSGWRQVPAMLLADASSGGYYDSPVPARWTAPDGTPRTGTVYPSPGAQAGTTTTIWVNASGRQMESPLSPFQATTQADIAAVIAGHFWGVILLGAGILGRHLIDARRMAAWDADLRTANLSGPAGTSP